MDKDGICPLCTEKVDEEEFRNEVFMREFKSSGLCQGCQDMIFGYKVAWWHKVDKEPFEKLVTMIPLNSNISVGADSEIL
jgi:hypothetical protein